MTITWIDAECPECRSDRVFANGHDEHCCQDCGEVFYVSARDTVGSYQDYLELTAHPYCLAEDGDCILAHIDCPKKI